MSSEHLDINRPSGDLFGTAQREVVLAELAPEPPEEEAVVPRHRRRRVGLPIFLFVATCLSTVVVGAQGHLLVLVNALAEGYVPNLGFFLEMLQAGTRYAVPVMTILVCHEAGHFLQARRYGVHCSLPYFIPMPISPLGTFGAVIAMEARMGDRKALFDVGISGPLAGLVPTLIFCVWGLHWSHLGLPHPVATHYGDPLIFKWLARAILGPTPPGYEIIAHPIAFAGWVGLLVTSLNLIPIGQLDGGHILYALLRRRAYPVALLMLFGAAVAVIIGALVYGYPAWILMLVLLALMGPYHPPTANDNVRLGPVRVALGWLTLAFVVLGLTPMPIIP